MNVTKAQYALYRDAAFAKCQRMASVYGKSLDRYAEQEGYRSTEEMIQWETTVIAYGGELKPDAGLTVIAE